jgi:hypothetical protein
MFQGLSLRNTGFLGSLTKSTILPTDLSGLVGWYDVSSWNGSTQWSDKSGNGNNVVLSSSWGVSSQTGNGSNKVFNALAFLYTDTATWPVGVLPSTYTLFHVARYKGDASNRILSASDVNWLSGFWANRSDVAFHNGWITDTTGQLANNYWVLSTDQNDLYRANGTNKTIAAPGSPSYGRITINAGVGAENSSGYITEVIVYNRTLSSYEISQVEAYLSVLYGIPIL